MKRRQWGLTGWPGHSATSHDVAGGARPKRATRKVASFLDALPMPDVAVMTFSREFAEFMEDTRGAEIATVAVNHPGLPWGPDPIFQERLRRQLWRTHLLTRARSRFDRH